MSPKEQVEALNKMAEYALKYDNIEVVDHIGSLRDQIKEELATRRYTPPGERYRYLKRKESGQQRTKKEGK